MSPDLHIDDLEREVDAYCLDADAAVVEIDAHRIDLEREQRKLRERLERLKRIEAKMTAAEKRVHDKYPGLFGAAGLILMAKAIRAGQPTGESPTPERSAQASSASKGGT